MTSTTENVPVCTTVSSPEPYTTSSLPRAAAYIRRVAYDVRAQVGFVVALLFAASTAIYANGDNACHCAITSTDAPLVEWDFPMAADFGSGAISVDVHPNSHKPRLWFVSRIGNPPRLFRFEVGKKMPVDNAKWKSFELSDSSLITGGLHRIKIHDNDRWIFVRTLTSLQRIDTGDCTTVLLSETCKRVTWMDQADTSLIQASDLAIDDCNVYTTTAVTDSMGNQVDASSYLQQVTHCGSVTGTSGTTQVKRWLVGGGAGVCNMLSEGSPCISGVTVDRHGQTRVYFSEPDANVIGELNPSNNTIRRWSLNALDPSIAEPRQLDIDDDGMVWTVTGSGHLVRLDPKHNKMSAHLMPNGAAADPFGVAPDHGAVGYTNTNSDPMTGNKIGMLLPKGAMVTVNPTSAPVTPTLVPVDYMVDGSPTVVGTSMANPKMAIAHLTDKADGTFIEAQVGNGDSGNGSWNPLGVSPDFGRRVGSYFYAVGNNMDNGLTRIGHIQLPFVRKDHRFARDDDDNDGVHHGNGDDDDDGVKDSDDDATHHETRDQQSADVQGGQSTDYQMAADANSTLLTTTLTALDLGTMLAVEVYDPAGQLVASPLPTPGVAVVSVPPLTVGTYTVRVKNLGILPTTFTTTMVTKAVWPVLPDLP